MTSIAILVSNSIYNSNETLACCKDDLIAIEKLFKATSRFEQIEILENLDSKSIKTRLREICEKKETCEEVVFYFTGHGYQNEEDLYYCATDFNSRKPNETGLSNEELHTYIRALEPQVFVKIVDACNSGVSLIKNFGETIKKFEGRLKNVIQIASCLNNQSSITGQPLSEFTGFFIDAALNKTEGPVYYTDIISVLRDKYIGNELRTPYFVTQGTGLEKFCDDASFLDSLRKEETESSPVIQRLQEIAISEPSNVDILTEYESKLVTTELANTFIDRVFSYLHSKVESKKKFQEFYNLETKLNSDFDCEHSKSFLINILSKEKRSDELVTAEISREYKRKNPFGGLFNLAALNFGRDDAEYTETHSLNLNCDLKKVQIEFIFTPKFRSLPKVTLTVTCAPSLEKVYVFENVCEQLLTDFGHYGSKGKLKYRKWYKFDWHSEQFEDFDKIISRIEALLGDEVITVVEKLK